MSKLFTPYNLSGLALKNRVVMAPMTRTRTMNDVPDEVVALYYAQRASAGLLITEGMPVSEEGRGYLYTPGIYNDEHVQGWRKGGLRANDVKNHVNRLTYCFILIIRCCIYSYSNDHGADGRWNAIPSRLIA